MTRSVGRREGLGCTRDRGDSPRDPTYQVQEEQRVARCCFLRATCQLLETPQDGSRIADKRGRSLSPQLTEHRAEFGCHSLGWQ